MVYPLIYKFLSFMLIYMYYESLNHNGRTLHDLLSPDEGDKELRINEGDTETNIF